MFEIIVIKENDNIESNIIPKIKIIPLTNILSAREVFLNSISLLNNLYSINNSLPKNMDAKMTTPSIIFNKIIIIINFRLLYPHRFCSLPFFQSFPALNLSALTLPLFL